MDILKFATADDAVKLQKYLFNELSVVEVAVVNNPDYIYSPIEIYPLAPKIAGPVESLCAIVKDMDGTITTTEPLCLYSQEQVLRRISGKMGKEQWKGLDNKIDYLHIIGNSTTKHIEYLINKYYSMIDDDRLRESYFEALLWTLAFGKDPGRKSEIKQNLMSLNIKEVLEDSILKGILKDREYKEEYIYCHSRQLSERYKGKFNCHGFGNRIRIAMDIYYTVYHSILASIYRGEGSDMANKLLKNSEERLVKPMPGVAVLLLLTKGLLHGEDADYIYEMLAQELSGEGSPLYEGIISREQFIGLINHFNKNTLKIAVVTSSIAYEADIILTEVFRVIREQIQTWGIPESTKRKYILAFENYKGLYDVVVTASDSNEIRLKPHRDLYSIALHRLGINKEDYKRCIGFEDSESGCISIRAAGIGLCIALPFTDTQGHDFNAASHILHWGLPEFILKNKCMVKI